MAAIADFRKIDVSIVITTYNDGEYLEMLLRDLSEQRLGGLSIEIIIVDAGRFGALRARHLLSELAERLRFLERPGLSRTAALNEMFALANGELIVRLDARSHIDADYITRIWTLSKETGAENVGGVMLPVGRVPGQVIIAKLMREPLCLGGAKARSPTYKGVADSVYLGAYRRKIWKPGVEWFDASLPQISEDSDLNFRLRKAGGKIFVDARIVVWHYPRETLRKFWRLCFNYGVGRGLFILKHRTVTGLRQLAPPLALAVLGGLFLAGFENPQLWGVALGLWCVYLLAIAYVAVRVGESAGEVLKACAGIMGCHCMWAMGLIWAPIVYRRARATLK